MLHTPYTTLCELIAAEDPTVTSIFDQYAVKQRSQFVNQQTQLSQRKVFARMITMGDLVSEEDATERMRDVLKKIRNAGNDFYGGMAELTKVLTNEGIFKLMQVLASHPEDDNAVIDQILSPLDQIQSLFRGLPLFDIVVVDVCADPNSGDIDLNKAKGVRGRYEVYLEKRISNERYPVTFDTKESKVLFIWFLLNCRKEFKKMYLVNHANEFINLFDTCFPMTKENTIYNKMQPPKDKEEQPKDKMFERFWNHSKGRANYAIVTALGERDKAEWYIVDLTDENYSLSLPEDYIRLPHSLKELDFCK